MFCPFQWIFPQPDVFPVLQLPELPPNVVTLEKYPLCPKSIVPKWKPPLQSAESVTVMVSFPDVGWVPCTRTPGSNKSGDDAGLQALQKALGGGGVENVTMNWSPFWASPALPPAPLMIANDPAGGVTGEVVVVVVVVGGLVVVVVVDGFVVVVVDPFVVVVVVVVVDGFVVVVLAPPLVSAPFKPEAPVPAPRCPEPVDVVVVVLEALPLRFDLPVLCPGPPLAETDEAAGPGEALWAAACREPAVTAPPTATEAAAIRPAVAAAWPSWGMLLTKGRTRAR